MYHVCAWYPGRSKEGVDPSLQPLNLFTGPLIDVTGLRQKAYRLDEDSIEPD